MSIWPFVHLAKKKTRGELRKSVQYNPGRELAAQYEGLYGKQSLKEKKGEMAAQKRQLARDMALQQQKRGGARPAGAAGAAGAARPPVFLEVGEAMGDNHNHNEGSLGTIVGMVVVYVVLFVYFCGSFW